MIFLYGCCYLLAIGAALCDLDDKKPWWFFIDFVIMPIGVVRFFYLWKTK